MGEGALWANVGKILEIEDLIYNLWFEKVGYSCSISKSI